MNKTKVLSLVAITLLLLQVFSPNLGLMAASQTESDASAKVEVKQISHQDDSIDWQVIINTSGEENDVTKTNIIFSSGQQHGSIKDVNNIDIEKTPKGYTVETEGGNNTYNIELSTVITSDEQTTFSLQVEMDYGGTTYQASDQITVKKPTLEETAEEQNDESKKKSESERSTEDQEGAESEQAEAKQEKAESDQGEVKQREELKTFEEILAELKSKSLEKFTEEEIKRLVEGLSDEELQKLQEEIQMVEEGVIDSNFHPFVKNKQSKFSVMTSNVDWPAPGSVNLNGKDATPTGNYGEWEIELSVVAKDVDTTKTTDIVLVFDRSGSMQGNRLAKAKQAAKQFVDELLTEGSQTRIAIVTFSDNYQTLAGGFQGAGGKQSLLNAINGISASGGTNIQGGLRTANNLLANDSSAQNKIIVLLSDGEPTYSYKANNATAHNWPYGSYNFKLSNFTNEQLGSGSSYNLSAPTCIPFLGCFGGEQYTVNGYDVKTNGIATISEAWHVMNNSIAMYSIGLDVGNNSNATNVLRNSQNRGYFQAGQDDLDEIFGEIAGELKYAATNAVVTDPLGDMFNLVKGKYNGANFSASHGSVNWDESTETITWNIGSIKEGEKPTLKYTVTIDWEHPDLKGYIDYPMNKQTPLNYIDVNGDEAVKHFAIPKGQIDKGKIKRIGYRMNAQGDPIDEQGNVVTKEEAQIFYDEYYEENNSKFFNYSTHDVPSKEVQDYTLYTDSPIELTLSPNNPVQTAWFGYVKTTDMVAGDVTAKYVDEDGNEIVDQEIFSGNIGDDYETEQKDVTGYEFKEIHQNSDSPTGKFKKEEQTVIYVYKKKLGLLTVNKVDVNGGPLEGAEFKLTGADGFEASGISNEDGKITFENLEWGTYTLIETKAPEGYRLLTGEMEVEISKENLHVEEMIENTKQDWKIPKTGGFGTLGFYGLGLILMVAAAWFFIKRRQA